MESDLTAVIRKINGSDITYYSEDMFAKILPMEEPLGSLSVPVITMYSLVYNYRGDVWFKYPKSLWSDNNAGLKVIDGLMNCRVPQELREEREELLREEREETENLIRKAKGEKVPEEMETETEVTSEGQELVRTDDPSDDLSSTSSEKGTDQSSENSEDSDKKNNIFPIVGIAVLVCATLGGAGAYALIRRKKVS